MVVKLSASLQNELALLEMALVGVSVQGAVIMLDFHSWPEVNHHVNIPI